MSFAPSSFPPVLIVAGPTASGKSAAALWLAQTRSGQGVHEAGPRGRPAVILNADPQQSFDALRTLTARPTPAEEALVPHRLYGGRRLDEPLSAASWAAAAAQAVEAALAEGQWPILVGGTGLYLEALLVGLPPMPDVPAEIRRAATERLATLGHPAFHAEVRALDPVLGARLKTGDTQRLIRAWEVATSSGRPLSAWQAAMPVPPLRHPAAMLTLLPPAPVRARLIHDRFVAMLAAGAAEEVAAARAAGLQPGWPGWKVHGVPELAALAEGTLDLQDAIDRATLAIRGYAKRQSTWLRNRLQPGAGRLVSRIDIQTQFDESAKPGISQFIAQA